MQSIDSGDNVKRNTSLTPTKLSLHQKSLVESFEKMDEVKKVRDKFSYAYDFSDFQLHRQKYQPITPQVLA